MYPLVIVRPTLATQARVQALTAVTDTHLGQLAQALAQHGVIAAVRFVGPTGALQANDPIGSADRNAISVE